MLENFVIHHIGYAVKDIEKAIAVFQKLNLKLESSIIEDIDRNIKEAYLASNGTLIELISILNSSKKSPIDFLFDKKFFLGNGMPYHICYSVKNIDEAIEYLNDEGFKLLQAKAPAIAMEDHNVAFLFHKDIGMIELYER